MTFKEENKECKFQLNPLIWSGRGHRVVHEYCNLLSGCITQTSELLSSKNNIKEFNSVKFQND